MHTKTPPGEAPESLWDERDFAPDPKPVDRINGHANGGEPLSTVSKAPRGRRNKPVGLDLDGIDIIRSGPKGDGTPKPIFANAVALLRSKRDFFNLRFDDFSHRPYRGSQKLTDTDFFDITNYVQRAGIHADVRVVTNAVIFVASECRFHQVREYLDPLVWDGVSRLEEILIDHGGAAATPVTRAMTKRWFIQAVARIYNPGCQADAMLILEGDQGLKKSGFFGAIGRPWFIENLSDLGSKDAMQEIRGVWVVEMAELSSMTRSEISNAKSFITRREDHYRESYGRMTSDYPRQCVFAGTVNPGAGGYLKDETGGRRYWPVAVAHEIDLATVTALRDQYWAEAVAAYKAGEVWYLDTPDLQIEANEEQADRYETDAWDDIIENFIGGRNYVSTAEILRDGLGVDVSRISKADQMRVAKTLTKLKWRKKKARPPDEVGTNPRNLFWPPHTQFDKNQALK